jgi:fumarate reductase flavoprotein subunit
VRPAQHYTMGGVRTNATGESPTLKGLFAAGEAACWDMHGFNRLGGNSLAETVVAGGIVGKKIAEFLQGAEGSIDLKLVRDTVNRQQERIADLTSGKSGREEVFKVRSAMQDALMDGCFVFRNGTDLERCVATLQEVYARSLKIGLKSDGKGANPELSAALKLPGQVRLALSIAQGALKRTESRGSHTREDYPERNDRDWMVRTLAFWPEGADLPRLEYEEVTPWFEIPPGERGYGGGKIITADQELIDSMTRPKMQAGNGAPFESVEGRAPVPPTQAQPTGTTGKGK